MIRKMIQRAHAIGHFLKAFIEVPPINR